MKKSQYKIKTAKRKIELIAEAIDASYYKLIPKNVLLPESVAEIQEIFHWAQSGGFKLCFRAGGTSLSGQSASSEYLVKIRRGWDNIEIFDGGEKAKVGPAVIGGKLNEYLKKYGRKFPPDPASINACMIGGMLANNSSGMSSGIERNPYKTLESMAFVLPSGVFIDTANFHADAILKEQAPEIYAGLLAIRDKINNNPEIKNKIIRRYQIKNVIGYSLNAFLDFASPIDILTRLIVGSEGTLAFIAGAVFNTIPLIEKKNTGLMIFESSEIACKKLIELNKFHPLALEFMDYYSLLSVQELVQDVASDLNFGDGAAALLIEFDADKAPKQEDLERAIRGATFSYFTDDASKQAEIWQIRQGLLPSLGKMRPAGTTAIIEDVAFDIERLGEAIAELNALFAKHKYQNVGIYGHGLDGNVHFIISQSFNSDDEIKRYAAFMDELSELVIDKLDGSLKAEHGTGRNMTPYVEKQWGAECYAIMREIKSLIDPQNMLNPDVIFSDNPNIHTENIEDFPVTNDLIDKCIECGFCEPVCPSANLTFSPRKRIAIERAFERGDIGMQELRDYQYYSIDTCAGDGMCASVCPVGINTGDLIKSLRSEQKLNMQKSAAKLIVNNFQTGENLAKCAINVAHIASGSLGETATNLPIKAFESLFRTRIQKWNKNIGLPAKIGISAAVEPEFVYFPCCVSRMMGKPEKDEKSLIEVMQTLAEKARINLMIPKDISKYCCGQAFSSKGYFDAFSLAYNKTIELFYESSRNGEIPIVLDSTSCSYSVRSSEKYLSDGNLAKFKKMRILDSIEFADEFLLPRLNIKQINKKVVLHNTCASTKLKLNEKLKAIAEICASEVIVPIENGCCAFAGDRGMLFPELTKSATEKEALEVIGINADAHYSSNIPCEVGMASATKKTYRSFLYLIEESLKRVNNE